MKRRPSTAKPEAPPKESPRAHKEHKSALLQTVRRIVVSGRTARAVFALLATVVGVYAIFRPHLSVEPYVSLNPVDPYRTQFTLKNENVMFEVHNIDSVCWPRKMESGNGFSIISPGPLQNVHHMIPSLEAGDSSTVDCPPVIGGIGTYSGQVAYAELEIVVSYRQSGWPFAVQTRYPFRAVQDVGRAVHWVHITPAEERGLIK